MPLLKQFKTPFGTIRVTQGGDGTLAYFQNGCYHSQSTPRGVSLCGYIHVLHQIICQKKARNVLIIGCGGGNLATMLRRENIDVTVVDINVAAFTIARDYFNMPDDVTCVAQNGLTFVRKTKQRFDAVVIDVFDADNNVPAPFTRKAFLGNAKKILKRGGVFLMNVMIKHADDHCADKLAKHVEAAGMPASIFEWSREKDSNMIVVGGSVSRLTLSPITKPAIIKHELKTLIRRKPRII